MTSFDETRRAYDKEAREHQKRGQPFVYAMPREEHWPLITKYWPKLELIHKAFEIAADKIRESTGVPLCVDNCGLCCTSASVFGSGVEAEYIASYLLGSPKKINPIMDRIRAWLTSTRQSWTYGALKPENFTAEVSHEVEVAAGERCPFLEDDLRCGIYEARPLPCRAYGVTHLPNHWCKRPRGLGESDDSYAIFDADKPIPIREMVDDLRSSTVEPKYSREGFVATMVFERFRARELAGLVDDGKVPLAKLAFGWGGQKAMLWQDTLNQQWDYDQTDHSIDDAIPLVEVQGVPVMRVGEIPR